MKKYIYIYIYAIYMYVCILYMGFSKKKKKSLESTQPLFSNKEMCAPSPKLEAHSSQMGPAVKTLP